MATWIAHLRVADYFMKKYEILNNEKFLVGNIGPDCGVPNEDWSSFTPDKKISHWEKNGKKIDAEDFKNTYLTDCDKDKFPFYFGYYFHLLTDIEWSKLYEIKMLEPIYYENMEKDSKFIWTIKKDWYGQDHLFLKRNPDFVFYKTFINISEFRNQYFDFYPKDAFTRQIKYISNYYLDANEDETRDFIYLSRQEMDNFVENTILRIEEHYKTLQEEMDI